MKHLKRLLAIGLPILLTAALGGCSDHGTDPVSGGGDNSATISFAADLQPVFAANCLGCHGAGGNGGLDLNANVAWANLVGVQAENYAPRQRVVSANPGESILYLKLSGAAGVGSRMPPNGALPEATIEKFRLWILEGALDN